MICVDIIWVELNIFLNDMSSLSFKSLVAKYLWNYLRTLALMSSCEIWRYYIWHNALVYIDCINCSSLNIRFKLTLGATNEYFIKKCLSLCKEEHGCFSTLSNQALYIKELLKLFEIWNQRQMSTLPSWYWKLVSTKLVKNEWGKLKLIKAQWLIFMSISWFSCA